MIRLPFTAALTLLGLIGCGQTPVSSNIQEAWNPINDPLRLGGSYERTLDKLPLEGETEKTPWSDTYWPSNQAGISFRWKDSGADQFAYDTPTLATLKQMSPAELAKLSPAEKYDVFVGNYGFPTVARERERTSPNNASWEGICHGWAPAAINFDEPHAVIAASVDGIDIPFGASDIKALLSYYQGEIAQSSFRNLGERCNVDLGADPEAATSPECRDTNAGAFHVVLANQLGIERQGFVADVTRDEQVWNQPVHGFKSKLVRYQEPSPGAAPGTVQEAVFKTEMSYTVEVDPQWQALLGTAGHSDTTEVYKYRVELNADGEIIGGEWLSSDRPDFLWLQTKPRFSGYFKKLRALYEQSVAAEPDIPDPTL